ncbi:hypothetical protein D3C83_145990 [compost metagenome]
MHASVLGRRADRHHRFAHALLLVGLHVYAAHAEHAPVELDRGLQIGDRHADVIDAQQPYVCDIVRGKVLCHTG